MASLVFRLWVLLLAVLLQVGSWRAEAVSSTSVVEASPFTSTAPQRVGDFDAPEEEGASEEQLSAIDDALDNMLVGAYHPGCSPAPSSRFQRNEEGLPAGGPALDTLFKPPRA